MDFPINIKNKLSPKVLLGGSIAIGSIAIFGASPAMAQALPVTGPLSSFIATCTTPGLAACTIGDKNFWDVGFQFVSGDVVSADDIFITASQSGALTYNINASYLGLPVPPGPPLQSKLNITYKAQVIDPNFVFTAVEVSSTWAGVSPPPSGDTITKELYQLSSVGSGTIGGLIDSIESVDGAPQSTTAIDGLTRLYVKDIYDSFDPGTGATQAVQRGWFAAANNFTQRPVDSVPGPLPILGAAAAFSYSRKLRSRVKSVAKAQ